MTLAPWDRIGSFHGWLLELIEEVVSRDPPCRVRVRGIVREVGEEDFGFSEKTLDKWQRSPPDDDYPDGKKMRDIVFSLGFKFFNEGDQFAIIHRWIHEELVTETADLTDELIGCITSLVEKSKVKFLLKCVEEVRDL